VSVDIRVVDNPDELRYEAWLGDDLAGFILYTLDGDVITLVHTDVEPRHEHEGIGSQLVRETLDDIRSRGLKMRPVCPFVAAFLDRHDEYADLVYRS
jgi:uncharacterized protein